CRGPAGFPDRTLPAGLQRAAAGFQIRSGDGLMAHGFSEDIVEEAGIEVLKALGWVHFHGTSIAPDGPSPQRLAFSEVILLPRLEKALGALNPHAPEAARTEAVRLLLTAATGSLVEV